MISYILYVCIVLYVTYIGYFFSDKYRVRKKFLENWEQFHSFFLSEMSYIRRPLPDVISRFEGKEEFASLLKEYSDTHEVQKRKFLTAEENDFLGEYFSFIGKSDYAGQRDYFSAVTQKMKNFTEKGQKDSAKYTDLYIKLGFLLGLAIVIFLV